MHYNDHAPAALQVDSSLSFLISKPLSLSHIPNFMHKDLSFWCVPYIIYFYFVILREKEKTSIDHSFMPDHVAILHTKQISTHSAFLCLSCCYIFLNDI